MAQEIVLAEPVEQPEPEVKIYKALLDAGKEEEAKAFIDHEHMIVRSDSLKTDAKILRNNYNRILRPMREQKSNVTKGFKKATKEFEELHKKGKALKTDYAEWWNTKLSVDAKLAEIDTEIDEKKEGLPHLEKATAKMDIAKALDWQVVQTAEANLGGVEQASKIAQKPVNGEQEIVKKHQAHMDYLKQLAQ